MHAIGWRLNQKLQLCANLDFVIISLSEKIINDWACGDNLFKTTSSLHLNIILPTVLDSSHMSTGYPSIYFGKFLWEK